MNNVFTMWLTGLSGAGKSTLAQEVSRYLQNEERKVQILDGDIIRNDIGHLFGYSKEERIKMSKVIQLVARVLNNNGISVIVAAIAPYEEMRDAVRSSLHNYMEVYVNCSLDECIKRDTKGLYKKALRGDMQHVVGIDDIYEIPRNFDVEVRTYEESIPESVMKIIKCLESKFPL